MKKLLTSKAGATFNLECPDFTFVVRKDVVEIVFKVRPEYLSSLILPGSMKIMGCC